MQIPLREVSSTDFLFFARPACTVHVQCSVRILAITITPLLGIGEKVVLRGSRGWW